MMARQHAPFGFVGYGATIEALHLIVPSSKLLGNAAEPMQLLFGCILASYAALIPDWDSPTSTVSVKGGFLTEFASRHVIAPVSGGHRQLTHSLVFCFIMYVVGFLFSLNPISSGILFAISMFLIGRFIVPGKKLFKRSEVNTAIGVAAIAGGAVLAIPQAADFAGLADYSWIPLAMGVGGFMHCAADSLTVTGTPWFYPFAIRVRGINAPKKQTALVSIKVKRKHEKKDNLLKIPIFTTNADSDNPLNKLDAVLLFFVAVIAYVFTVDPLLLELTGESPLRNLLEAIASAINDIVGASTK